MPHHQNMKKQGRVLPFERDGDFFLRLGSQRLEHNDLLEAISNYHRAMQLDPENLEIQLAIAEVLTEMNRYELSNQLLFPMLSLMESPSECFFGLACNFLGMQEFSQAQDSLESYLSLDPEGEFVNDALDMLEIIEDSEGLYSLPGVHAPEEREALNACSRGRWLLEFGRIDEAIQALEEASEKWPDILYVYNNLSLAYFCNKDYEKAMQAVNHVLDKEPYNVQGHCNLLLYLHAARDQEGAARELAFLKEANTEDPQDWNRMAVVMLEMGETQEALAVTRRLQAVYPYDENTLHRLAICCYKMGDYVAARDCYDRLLKIDPYDTIAAYYRRMCRKAAEGNPEPFEWQFHYEVPYTEMLRRVRFINEASRREYDELLAMWKKDENFRALLNWSLHLPDITAKRALLGMIASLGDANAERMLRSFLLNQMQPDDIKQDVFAMLKQMNAKEPYIAYLNGSLVQSRVSFRSIGRDTIPAAYQRMLELLMSNMKDVRSSATIIEAVDLFQEYINYSKDLPKLRDQQVYAFAAAFEYLACRNHNEEVTKTQIANQYGVTILRMKNALNKILWALEV